MDFIIEFIAEYLFVWFVSYPISFIRWGLSGFEKGKLEKYLKLDGYIQIMWAVLIGLGVFGIIKFINMLM